VLPGTQPRRVLNRRSKPDGARPVRRPLRARSIDTNASPNGNPGLAARVPARHRSCPRAEHDVFLRRLDRNEAPTSSSAGLPASLTRARSGRRAGHQPLRGAARSFAPTAPLDRLDPRHAPRIRHHEPPEPTHGLTDTTPPGPAYQPADRATSRGAARGAVSPRIGSWATAWHRAEHGTDRRPAGGGPKPRIRTLAFVGDARAHLGVTPVVVADGRTPWQSSRPAFIGNSKSSLLHALSRSGPNWPHRHGRPHDHGPVRRDH